MFIIFIYYFLSIATLCACYYFRRSRFTEKDYKYNKPLKWTRRILIIWMYLLAGTHASILMGTGFFRDVENDFIIFSAEFFLIAYIFAVCWVEDIIHPFDKKKK
ncbi:hypothetical protein [Gilliamella apicola]|uniref:hypothetical protein n=1 Tax=Gilliamella apicola TaxID=1196095 RepID=UPI000D9F7255|nr:hypothetical protein [Gilliamella apicola]PXV93963.1 hypothetical protein C7392_1064 [Gilliamella apicola]